MTEEDSSLTTLDNVIPNLGKAAAWEPRLF